MYVLNNSEKNIFFEKKSLYSPSGMVGSIMTIFSITQPFLDGSFSSSNSTEILMRQFCVQDFSTIGCSCEELSCKRPAGRTDTLTDSIVYSLFEYTKMGEFLFITYLINYQVFLVLYQLLEF